MKRRTEIKLNKAKVFSRKYIFSSRFIVRNSLVLLLAGTITAGGIFTIKNLPDYSEKQIALGSTSINAALEQADETVVADIAADGFEINSTDTMVINDDSIDILRSHLEDEESFDLAVGDTNNLTNSKYDMKGKFISTKKNANIYVKADGKSEVVGILPENASGKVLEKTDEWTKVSSGDIQGYVKTDCIVTDEEATKKAEDAVVEIATVNVDNIGVREGADEDSKILFLAENGESFVVNEVDQYDWTELDLVNGKTAYVSALYVDIEEGFREAIAPDAAKNLNDAIDVYTGVKTAEEVEEENKKTEEKVDEESEEKTDEKSEEKAEEETSETVEEKTEEKKEEKVEEPTEEKEEEKTEEPTEEPTEESTEEPEPIVANADDVYLLAAIVYAEAGGECYEGQLAVASVIMNRLHNGYWGSTLADVIYSPCQFTGCQTSAFSSALSTGGSSSCLQAAQAALAGENNIGGCMYFLPTWNVDTSELGDYTQIGNHIFW